MRNHQSLSTPPVLDPDAARGRGEGAAGGRRPTMLLVTYNFPPTQTIGSVRVGKIALHFAKRGWNVRVVTTRPSRFGHGGGGMQLPELPTLRVIRTAPADVFGPLRPLRTAFRKRRIRQAEAHPSGGVSQGGASRRSRMLSWLQHNVAEVPDPKWPWYFLAMRAARRFLKREHVDVVMSSSYPVVCHFVGAALKARSAIPWVADLRDPWTEHTMLIGQRTRLVEWIHLKLEQRTLRRADWITTVSDSIAADYQARYPHLPVLCMRNGFDPDDYPEPAGRAPGKLRFVYTGSLYDGRRDPTTFFGALQLLFAEQPSLRERLEVLFAGPPTPVLGQLIARFELQDVVEWVGNVPYHQSLALQRSADVLLIFDSPINARRTASGKVFEYFGAGRPLLAKAQPEDELTRVIHRCEAGEVYGSAEEAVALLKRYVADAGKLRAWKASDRVVEYTRDAQISKLRVRLEESLVR